MLPAAVTDDGAERRVPRCGALMVADDDVAPVVAGLASEMPRAAASAASCTARGDRGRIELDGERRGRRDPLPGDDAVDSAAGFGDGTGDPLPVDHSELDETGDNDIGRRGRSLRLDSSAGRGDGDTGDAIGGGDDGGGGSGIITISAATSIRGFASAIFRGDGMNVDS